MVLRQVCLSQWNPRIWKTLGDCNFPAKTTETATAFSSFLIIARFRGPTMKFLKSTTHDRIRNFSGEVGQPPPHVHLLSSVCLRVEAFITSGCAMVYLLGDNTVCGGGSTEQFLRLWVHSRTMSCQHIQEDIPLATRALPTWENSNVSWTIFTYHDPIWTFAKLPDSPCFVWVGSTWVRLPAQDAFLN